MLARMKPKRPFDVDEVFARLREAVRPFPRAALFELADEPHVSVDVHVHRIVNHWGLVATKTPEQTAKALEMRLPRERWIETNRLLVPFGKHICTGARPRCSTCPLLELCLQMGVGEHR